MEPMRAEVLLADLQWLQGLARELASDPELAADAVQDTFVAAMRHAGPLAHPRAWLATVLRNGLALARRGRCRASRRELLAARPEALAGTDELVQRAELQQRLVGVVLQLPAAHRDVVLLRFFDGLPPRAIAARLGVPIATVRSRLQRSLQQLRSVLDRDCGTRWATLLLAWPAAAPWPVSVVGVLMQTKLKVALAVLLAAGTATWWWSGTAGGASGVARPDESVAQAPRRHGGGDGEGGGVLPSVDARRSLEPRPPQSDPPAATAARVTVRGRVCDCDGRAMAGVPVVASGDDAKATSDPTGAFALDLLPRPTSLAIADDERYVAVMGAQWAPDSRLAPVLVAAPALHVGGRVVDGRGAPVLRGQVLVQLPEDFDARFPVPLDRGERHRWNAITGADGRFALGRIPRIDGASLLATADALAPAVVPLPPADTDELEIRLAAFAFEAGQLDGLVVDPQGVPVAGARVAMGVTSVVSDSDGRFALLLRRAGWPTAIVAAKAGFQPARFELPRGGGTKRADWPDRVVLQLGAPPLAITGRVVDERDHPIAKALVWIADPTLLGIAGVLPLQTEYLLAGGEVPRQVARMKVPFADDPTQDGMFLDQSSHAPDPTASWFFVETDAQGHFDLPGLLPREYRVRAFDVATGIGAEVGPVPAGSAAEVRITRTGLWPELHGRVVSVRGEPIAGVEVAHVVRLFRTNERVPGGRFEGNAIRDVATVRSGDDGSFVLRDVSRAHSVLSFAGEAILPRSLFAEEIADPRQVAVTVEARCHVEVALQDPHEADEVAATTADGQPLDITVLRAGSHQATTELELHDGKSGVFVLGERAGFLLLRRGGEVVRKVPLQLQPGTTFRVQ